MTIRSILFLFKHKRQCKETRRLEACRELARDVERRKASFAVQDYAKRRAAALKATRGMAS
jgi:hypothetical protein